MKKIITILLLVFNLSFVFAQRDFIDRHFDEYMGQEGFTSLSISRSMFSLFADIDEESEDVEKAISRLTGLKMLAAKEMDYTASKSLWRKAIRSLEQEGFEELLNMVEDGEEVSFYGKKSRVAGRVTELVMLVGGRNNNFLVLTITGDISLKEIAKLTRNMDIEGLDKIEGIEE
jgi:hypothetical protein